MSDAARRAKALLDEVNAAGGCSRPIRLRGQLVSTQDGEISTKTLHIACKDRRAILCPSCSYLYKADAWILVAAGINGGKGVDESVAEHPKLFATLTAPSFGAVHSATLPAGRCRARAATRTNVRTSAQTSARSPARCPHGRPTLCKVVHKPHDPIIGAALCDDCFDHRGAVLWNASASKLWHRTAISIKRGVAAQRGISEAYLAQELKLSYLKVAEVQRRGLIHLHVILRADGPGGPGEPPPGWCTTELMAVCVRQAAKATNIAAPDGSVVRWGTQLDVTDLSPLSEDGAKVAGYLAKYATKTTGGAAGFATRFKTRREIVSAEGPEHLRRLALEAWDLGSQWDLRDLRLRAHAHSLGFTGQLITKSRSYSTTFGELRGARAAFRAQAASSVVVPESFAYTGRGYDDPDAERLAEVIFEA